MMWVTSFPALVASMCSQMNHPRWDRKTHRLYPSTRIFEQEYVGWRRVLQIESFRS